MMPKTPPAIIFGMEMIPAISQSFSPLTPPAIIYKGVVIRQVLHVVQHIKDHQRPRDTPDLVTRRCQTRQVCEAPWMPQQNTP